jgi:hypothetical protein
MGSLETPGTLTSVHPAACASAPSVRRSQEGFFRSRESVSFGKPLAAAQLESLPKRARAATAICASKVAGRIVDDVIINKS